MIQNMEWEGAQGLGEVETLTWSVDGRPAGTWVQSRGLTYAKVREWVAVFIIRYPLVQVGFSRS